MNIVLLVRKSIRSEIKMYSEELLRSVHPTSVLPVTRNMPYYSASVPTKNQPRNMTGIYLGLVCISSVCIISVITSFTILCVTILYTEGLYTWSTDSKRQWQGFYKIGKSRVIIKSMLGILGNLLLWIW